MIKNVYVINSENIYWWMPTRKQAEDFIEQIKKEGQKDIRFTYSRCRIEKDNNDEFEELEVLDVYMD